MNYCDWCIIKIISIINPSKGDVTLITTEYRFDHVNTYKICYVYNITRGGYCHCWELGFSPILAGKDSPNFEQWFTYWFSYMHNAWSIYSQ